MIEIIDDYLEEQDHKMIYDYFMGHMDKGDLQNSCCWSWLGGISIPNDGHFQFVHQVYTDHTILSPAFQLLKPILEWERLAQGLLEYETLTGDEIKRVIRGEPPQGDDDPEGDAAKSDSSEKASVMAVPKTKSRIKGKSGGKMTPEAT